MKLSASKVNRFNMFKLPAAYFTGVRAKELSDRHCKVTVSYRWINQNPFRSMFWAVQGMAAELTTGALVMKKIMESGRPVSMLVLHNKGQFLKKARGRITFICNQGDSIDEVLNQALETGEGQTIWLEATGKDTKGNVVSVFSFEWTLKVKN